MSNNSIHTENDVLRMISEKEEGSYIKDDKLYLPEQELTVWVNIISSQQNNKGYSAQLLFFINHPYFEQPLVESCAGVGNTENEAIEMCMESFYAAVLLSVQSALGCDCDKFIESDVMGEKHIFRVPCSSGTLNMGGQFLEKGDLWTVVQDVIPQYLGCKRVYWVKLFAEVGEKMGVTFDMGELFTKMYGIALEGEPDCGGLLSYNFLSGEPVVGAADSRLEVKRTAESRFTLANFMRMHLCSALGALKVGLDLMLKEEGVKVDRMLGHGGYFKTPLAGQKIAAAMVGAPVSVMETAGEGGAWGIAVLAQYTVAKLAGSAQTLQQFLDSEIFASMKATTIAPDAADVAGCEEFMKSFRAGL